MTDPKIEELKQEAKRQVIPGCGTVISSCSLALKAIALAETLTAQLSAIRDAGDEEAEDLAREAGNGIGSDYFRDKKGCNEAEECLNRLKDIAISRGQQIEQLRVQLAGCLCAAEGATNDPAKQGDYGWSLPYQKTLDLHQKLRERDAEIKRLRMAVGCATTIKGDMVMRADDPLGMMQEVCQYAATLTAERDDLKDWKEDVLDQMRTTMDEECGKDEKHCTCVPLLRHQVKEMQSSVNLATGMCDEVIAERDEAVGLLKWVVKHWDFIGRVEGLAKSCAIEDWRDNARRILEIVDPGKRCERCGDKIEGHEDESGTRCRWCVTCGESNSGDSVCVVP